MKKREEWREDKRKKEIVKVLHNKHSHYLRDWNWFFVLSLCVLQSYRPLCNTVTACITPQSLYSGSMSGGPSHHLSHSKLKTCPLR